MASKNTLSLDGTRMGYLFDGDPTTPEIAAQLVKSPTDIRAAFPWLREPNRIFERWFGSGALWGDDPDKTRHRYSPPESMDFHDTNGPVALVGCRAGRSSSTIPAGIGVGEVIVDYAILGARGAAKYQTINGLRSEVEGLGTWVGLRSLDAKVNTDNANRIRTVDLHLEAPDPIPISHGLNLHMRPNYHFTGGDHPDETVIRERLLVETTVNRARKWAEHLEAHYAIRDLVRIAAWRKLGFVQHWARRFDDVPDQGSREAEWHEVDTYRTGISEPSSRLSRSQYLFDFANVKPEGVRRWLRLRKSMRRGVMPIVGLLNLQEATIETHFAELGIGFEALGYKIALDGGLSTRRQKRSRLKHV